MPAPQDFPAADFADVLTANKQFAATFGSPELSGVARKGLAIITCMDSRIDPLAIVGMNAGDVKILRNAGARVTDDVLRTLVLATHLLGVNRVLVMPHTNCKMASATEEQIHQQIQDDYGTDTRSFEFRVVEDQLETLGTDVQRIRSLPLMPPGVVVGGALYHVESGVLEPIDC